MTDERSAGVLVDRDALADHLAIEGVIARVGRWLDGLGGDPADLYDPDVSAYGPRGAVHGVDALVSLVDGSDVGELTQHVNTDLLVELDGDVAVVHSNQTVRFYEQGREPHRTSGLRVTYGLRARAGRWRVSRMDVELAWIVGAMPATPSPQVSPGPS